MKVILIALLVFVTGSLFAQRVELISLDHLYQRVKMGKDTTYIINFWATWCAPCVKELTHFEKLSENYKDSPLKVLLISLDTRSKMNQTVVPFVKKNGLANEVFLLDEKDQQVYINRIDSSWSGALPATLMVKQRHRKFFEQAFSYEELLKQYKKMNAYETPGTTRIDRSQPGCQCTDQYHYTGHKSS
jgi:thiol-disulfide isomerase/thioredoxin